MEFKGTKGKWYIDYNGFYNEILSTSNSYDGKVFKAYTLLHDCETVVVDLSNCDEDKANALLISKSPEMLEMLKSIVSHFGDDDKHFSPFELKLDIDKAKQLIKEATEL